MKLSIAIPSHNWGSRTKINILNACSLASEKVEVLIRDNSANKEKREFLSHIHKDNCRIMLVDECSGMENTRKVIESAKGEFVFFAADDDHVNTFGVPALLEQIQRIGDDPDIIGTSGITIVDDGPKTAFAYFDCLNKANPVERFRNLFSTSWPSVFQYSPIRRSVLLDCWSFTATLPVFLCYHDLLMNCMCLMHGRVTYSERFIYQYFNENWSNPELHLASEASSFRKARLDTSAVRLQWLIAAYEGTRTFKDKYQRARLSQEQREALGSFWFQYCFGLFLQTTSRQAEGAKFDVQALRIANKWRGTKSVDLPSLLADITDYYSLSSPSISQRYYNFWK